MPDARARVDRKRTAPSTPVRIVFLLLFALDIGGACWLSFAPAPHRAELPPTDPGVPELVLLSERPQTALANTELTSAPETKADLAREQCRSIGPFATQADVRVAIAALTPRSARLRSREARETQAHGFWVYLPASPTREETLVTARALAAKNIRDYFVVTSGDRQNTISLGVFRDPANAERRRAEIAAQGFAAKTEPRSDEQPVYWVDYAWLDQQAVEWKSLLGDTQNLREETIVCF